MAEGCCSNGGCGCGSQETNIYTIKDCPECGRRLRVTGNIQRVKLYLTCQNCGYRSGELSLEEIREFIG